jgi:GNAT superfamily N-acetyltransferase
MAVDPVRRGHGSGALLLAAGLERAGARGADVVWANARDTALAFYERHGFRVVGDGFVDATTALPHHRIVRTLD